MSIDRTLHIKSGISSARNVLKRSERVDLMKAEGTFDEETTSVLGLPKTRIRTTKVGTKSKKAEPTEEEQAGTEEAAEKSKE